MVAQHQFSSSIASDVSHWRLGSSIVMNSLSFLLDSLPIFLHLVVAPNIGNSCSLKKLEIIHECKFNQGRQGKCVQGWKLRNCTDAAAQ